MLTQNFQEALRMVQHAIGPADHPNFDLGGVLLSERKIVATDGHRMAVFQTNGTTWVDGFLPAPEVKKILRLKPTRLEPLEWDELELTQEHRFPEGWHVPFRSAPEQTATLSVARLRHTLRAMICAASESGSLSKHAKDHTFVDLYLGEAEVLVVLDEPEAQANAYIEATTTGSYPPIHVNAWYLHQALAAAPHPNVVLELHADNKPMVLRCGPWTEAIALARQPEKPTTESEEDHEDTSAD